MKRQNAYVFIPGFYASPHRECSSLFKSNLKCSKPKCVKKGLDFEKGDQMWNIMSELSHLAIFANMQP